MKKIILTMFFTSVFLVFFAGHIFALDIIPSNVPQPGITCGDPNGVGDLKLCCKSPIITPQAQLWNNPVLNDVTKLVMDAQSKYANSIIQAQKSISLKPCMSGFPSTPGDINNPSCTCIISPTPTSLSVFESSCKNIKLASEQTQCIDCAHNQGGVWTALGCFNGNLSDFIANNIMKTGVGIAGGISMLCIMFAAFQMQTSRGNAEKIKKAQELMTNCITGLMVIIFSVLILKIIGVDILRLPGMTN